MKFKAVYKEIRKKLWNGEDKLNLFEKYKDKIDHEKLALLLSHYPDSNLAKKYNNLNLFLMYILLFVTFLKMVYIYILVGGADNTSVYRALIMPFGILINGVFLYTIFIKNVLVYRILALSAIKGIPNPFEYNLFSDPTTANLVYYIIVFIAMIIMIYIGFTLPKKMFPHHGWFHSKKTRNGLPIFTESQL